MRKQTKFVAVLSAAALFAIGASMTSFAATAHWEQEGEDWVYLDSDGDRVTDTWKKSGSNWFYLDSDGYMAKDTIVISGSNDDKYYVDANGAKVVNTWVSVDNEGDNECSDQEDVSTIWYFFGSNGKAKRGDSTKEVFTNIPYGANMENKGTFAFDEDGHMLSGWQDITLSSGKTYRYYFNGENEGWAALGWQYLEKPEDDNFEDENPFEDEAWFWFGTNGRAAQDTTKYIGGQYYTFSESGAMNDKWVQGTPGISDSTAVIASDADAFYTESIGHRRTGWIYAYDPDDTDEEGDQYWFYLNNKGEAYNDRGKDTVEYKSGVEVADYDATATKVFDETAVGQDVAAKVIKNKTFLFDENGRMLTGLRRIEGDTPVVKGDSDTAKDNRGAVPREGGKDLQEGIYYFSTESGSGEGAMETGKQVVSDEGDEYTYYFQGTGAAYINTLMKGAVYGEDGRRIEAEDGSKYELVVVANDIYDGDKKNTDGTRKVAIEAGTAIIVNSNGTVKKNASTVDVDGVKYSVKNYVAVEKEDQD